MVGVDHIELKLLVYYRLLDVAVEGFPHGLRVVDGVQQEYCAFRRAFQNVVLFHKRELVAADELRVAN